MMSGLHFPAVSLGSNEKTVVSVFSTLISMHVWLAQSFTTSSAFCLIGALSAAFSLAVWCDVILKYVGFCA